MNVAATRVVNWRIFFNAIGILEELREAVSELEEIRVSEGLRGAESGSTGMWKRLNADGPYRSRTMRTPSDLSLIHI